MAPWATAGSISSVLHTATREWWEGGGGSQERQRLGAQWVKERGCAAWERVPPFHGTATICQMTGKDRQAHGIPPLAARPHPRPPNPYTHLSTEVTLSSIPSRLRPASASSVASQAPSCSLRSLVCTLPRKLMTCTEGEGGGYQASAYQLEQGRLPA